MLPGGDLSPAADREGIVGMNGTIAIGVLLAAAAPAGQAPAPDRQRIEAARVGCRLPARFLRFGRDSRGDYAHVVPNGDLDRLDPKAFLCLIRWAGETGARIGFVSEPPRWSELIALGPRDSIRRAAEAARACGLPVRIDPLGPDEAILDARSDSPPGPLQCIRSWVERHPGLRLGVPQEPAERLPDGD
jgi:hypothetical protein